MNKIGEIKSLFKRMDKKYTLLESENVTRKEIIDANFDKIEEYIKNLNIDYLKKHYRDFSVLGYSQYYGNIFEPALSIKEVIGDIKAPDEVIKHLRIRYALPEDFAYIVEGFNNIDLYIVCAQRGENEKLVVNDMDKVGYFNGNVRRNIKIHEGIVYEILQFEPKSHKQNDESENIKNMHDFLYHWTPKYNLENILNNGLIPNHKNEWFKYPARTYLMKPESPEKVIGLGSLLCKANSDTRNKGLYSFLKIDVKKLNNHLYYDPNSEIGIYTEEVIPKEYITYIGDNQFLKL